MAANKITPFFDNLMKENSLKQNIFAFYFTKFPIQNSAILIGENNKIYYHEPLLWFPVIKKFYWQIEFSDISVNGVRQNFCLFKNCDLALDTGYFYF